MHFLPESTFMPTKIVPSISAARRCFADQDFDVAMINSPLPDEPGIRFAADVAVSHESVVLLHVKNDIHDDIYIKAAPYGVFTLAKPLSAQVMANAVRWLISARECIRKYEKKTLSIEEKMKDFRLVNRAKWILITEQDMTEQEAHRSIEKQAMDQCISRGEIAQEVIDAYSDHS